jgi:hypothetical protein
VEAVCILIWGWSTWASKYFSFAKFREQHFIGLLYFIDTKFMVEQVDSFVAGEDSILRRIGMGPVDNDWAKPINIPGNTVLFDPKSYGLEILLGFLVFEWFLFPHYKCNNVRSSLNTLVISMNVIVIGYAEDEWRLQLNRWFETLRFARLRSGKFEITYSLRIRLK